MDSARGGGGGSLREGSPDARRGLGQPATNVLGPDEADGLAPGAQAAFSSSKAAAARAPVEILIAPEWVLWCLLAVIAMLLLAATLGMIALLGFGRSTLWGVRRLFDVSKENNVPTYFSSFQLLAAAVLLGVIAATRP
jgi:hypothetical protein